jgi:micrococcal nuclease
MQCRTSRNHHPLSFFHSRLSFQRLVVSILMLAVLCTSAWASDPIVYITKTGAKYHVSGCISLRKSSIPIPLSEALARHYEPCQLCNPPRETRGDSPPTTPSQPPLPLPPSMPSSTPDLYRVDLPPPATSSAAVNIVRMLPARVRKHVDGDTVHVTIANPPAGIHSSETIRLLGVDTPETVDPRKPVQIFGKEASDFTQNRLLGKDIFLAFDWDLRDAYGRLLAYIYLPDGTCFNAELIREGYGRAYLVYPFHFLEEFRILDRTARKSRKGLWGL